VAARIVDAEALKARYLAEAVETATPSARLTMLYDRLELDLQRADAGFEAGDLKAISDNLIHAQEILLALHGTLKLDAWEAAPRLAALYDYLQRELLAANMDKDRPRLAAASALIGRLADAWRTAARAAGEATAGEVADGVA